jgi:hypothetical protein
MHGSRPLHGLKLAFQARWTGTASGLLKALASAVDESDRGHLPETAGAMGVRNLSSMLTGMSSSALPTRRALHALNIDIVCANSSQAKGRVERAHKTLRDPLVKELRLAGASTLAAGNALLPAFVADDNARFAKTRANKKDLHRPLRAGDDLEDAFAWKEERTLSQTLTLQYDKVIFILEPSEQAKAAIGKRVTVVDYPVGRLAIRHNGIEFAYPAFDKIRQVDQGAIADNKRRGPLLAMIRDEQLRRGPQRRSGPRRRDQRNALLFKVG